MAAPKVFLVHLRRPDRSNPVERRTDPFYEFGSFGCTKCHSRNLFNPRYAAALEGARLAFVQGGSCGSRLVFLTPPIKVKVWSDCCEAKWTPARMPFKYCEAPVLARNGNDSDFPLIEKLARTTKRRTAEGGLSSRIRARTTPLPSDMARQVMNVYARKRKEAPRSAIAEKYYEALPYAPRKIDGNRKSTYHARIRKLARDAGAGAHVLRGNSKSGTPATTHCGISQIGGAKRRAIRCT